MNGAIRDLPVGNTKVAAEMIRELTGAQLFEIVPQQAYSHDYNECINQAQADQRRDARPQIREYPGSLEEYDTIYLGYPNYWDTMPMCVFTFLEQVDFSGKTVYPFCTHEGSGMGHSEADIRRLCPGAKVEKGLAIHGADVGRAEKSIARWLGKERIKQR